MAVSTLSAPGRRRFWDFYTAPFTAWILFVCYATLAPPSGLPSFAFRLSDKLGHAFLFAVFAGLLLRSWVRTGRISLMSAAVVFAVSVLWGYYIECLQALTEYRSYSLIDLAADAAGSAIGIPAFALLHRAFVPALRTGGLQA